MKILVQSNLKAVQVERISINTSPLLTTLKPTTATTTQSKSTLFNTISAELISNQLISSNQTASQQKLLNSSWITNTNLTLNDLSAFKMLADYKTPETPGSNRPRLFEKHLHWQLVCKCFSKFCFSIQRQQKIHWPVL